jgi:hypothetical protein
MKTPQKNHHAPLLISANHWYYHRYQIYSGLLLASNAFHVDVASKYFLNLTCTFVLCTIITNSALLSERFSFNVFVSILLSSA